MHIIFYVWVQVRGMRERSPPLPKISHPSLPRLGRSQASTWPSAMHKSPPGGTACLITVSPMPGKLTYTACLPPFYTTLGGFLLLGFVLEWKECAPQAFISNHCTQCGHWWLWISLTRSDHNCLDIKHCNTNHKCLPAKRSTSAKSVSSIAELILSN